MHLDQIPLRLNRVPPAQWIWLAFAFVLPLSIAAESIALAGLAVWVVSGPRRAAREARRSPMVWPVLAFVALAATSWFWSVRPEATLQRMHRLLIPLAMFAIGGGSRGPGLPALRLAGAFAAGCALRGVYDAVRVPWAAARGADLFDAGNMRDPQMYLVALCLLLAFAGSPNARRPRRWLGAGIGLSGIGLLLHFKRGVWFAFLGAIAGMGIMTRRWRMLAAIGLAALCALAAPPVRHRLAKLEEVFQASTGGRLVLWRDAAPALLSQYPQGMGWCAVEHADLAAHTDYLQPKLNHLHNNLLQVALETGWAGLAAWLVWMAMLLRGLFRPCQRAAPGPRQALALGSFCGLTGLLLNGMVEYNFGDTEILLLFTLLGGIAVALEDEAPAPVAP